MANNDAQLMRQMLNRLESAQVIHEQKPMNWLQGLKLQATKPFIQGADTQLWSGNYANSIYKGWMAAASKDATGEDFIGWYSQSPQTSDVARVEDSFIRRVVYKVTSGKLNEPLTKEQVGQIAKDLADVTAKQALGMTHKLTTKSTPEQREKAMKILQTLTDKMAQPISSGTLSLNWIAKNLSVQHQIPPAAVRLGFYNFNKSLLRTPLPHFTTISARDRSILSAEQISSLIPVIDNLILAVVSAVQERTPPPPPPPPPPPTPPGPASVADIVTVLNDLRAAGLSDAEIQQAVNIIFGARP